MKQLIYTLILTISAGNLISQTYPNLSFRKPTTIDNITWKFKSVTSGVDAFITVIGSKNASLDKIDDSSTYKAAWNPFINYTSTPSSATDSSYLEFKIEFRNSDGTIHSFSNMAMTAVDNDGGKNGSNIYRELVKSTLPSTPKGFFGTTITSVVEGAWLTNVSGTVTFPTMDTANLSAMVQLNYVNVSSYNLRVGVVGRISGGTVREASFYFKNFNPLNIVLPVKLLNFNARIENNISTIRWSTASEQNLSRYELYRSLDGTNFYHTVTLDANGNNQIVSNYIYEDKQVAGEARNDVYYKLRMIEFSGEYYWSPIVQIKNNTNPGIILGSVYPKPTHGMLNISFESTPDSDVVILIVDLSGKTIQTFQNTNVIKSNTISLDVSELPNGVYFVKIVNYDGSSTSDKFIKN